MKILKLGLLRSHWRLVKDREKSTECIHGVSLRVAECDKCVREIEYDAEIEQPWRSAQPETSGGYCEHDISLDDQCDECRSQMRSEGQEPG